MRQRGFIGKLYNIVKYIMQLIRCYYGGVDWTSPTVLAFSYIYRAFGFLPSFLQYIYIYHDLTSYRKYTLFFLSYWLTDWLTDRPTDRPTDWQTDSTVTFHLREVVPSHTIKTSLRTRLRPILRTEAFSKIRPTLYSAMYYFFIKQLTNIY